MPRHPHFDVFDSFFAYIPITPKPYLTIFVAPDSDRLHIYKTRRKDLYQSRASSAAAFAQNTISLPLRFRFPCAILRPFSLVLARSFSRLRFDSFYRAAVPTYDQLRILFPPSFLSLSLSFRLARLSRQRGQSVSLIVPSSLGLRLCRTHLRVDCVFVLTVCARLIRR